MENKENSKKEKKMSKEERIAARQNQNKQVDQVEDDYAKEFYGVMPLIQSKEKVDRVLVDVGDLNSNLVDSKLWVRGRLFVSRKTTSIFSITKFSYKIEFKFKR